MPKAVPMGAEMKKRNHADIRDVLLQHSDGLTAEAVGTILNKPRGAVARALAAMPDAYIDRWIMLPGSRGQYSAIWCIVEVPEDCPHPRRNAKVSMSSRSGCSMRFQPASKNP